MSISTVIYIVQEYPAITQTFVADEIEAMRKITSDCAVVALNAGRLSVSSTANARYTRASRYTHVAFVARSTLLSVPRILGLVFARPRSISALSREAYAVSRAVSALIRLGPTVRGEVALHAHFAGRAFEVAYYMSLIARQPQLSVTVHAGDANLPASENTRMLKMLRETSSIVAASQFVSDLLAGTAGVTANAVVHCGLNILQWPRRDGGRLAGRSIRILSVGRLVKKKGFTTSIEASRTLSVQGIEHTWRIIGDGPLRDALSKQASGTSVELLGHKARSDIKALLYDWADVFVLAPQPDANDIDGIPVALMEALAAGVPSISTHIAGIPELIRDEETGLTVPQADADALATAIQRLASNDGIRGSIADRGRALVLSRFNIETEARALLEQINLGSA